MGKVVAEKQPHQLIPFLSESKAPPSVIFVYGPDEYTRNSLISRVVKIFLPEDEDHIFGLEDYEAQEIDPSHFIGALKTVPFGQPLKVVVIRRFELAAFSVVKGEKRQKETSGDGRTSPLEDVLIRYFSQPSKKTLLLISSSLKIRKNSSFYHSFPMDAVEVPCMGFKGREAVAFVKGELNEGGKRATVQWIEQFIEIVGPDAQRLKGELGKVFLLVDDRAVLKEEDLDIVSSGEGSRNIFALLDSIIQGKPFAAAIILREILGSGEPPLKILSILLWHYRLVAKTLRFKKLNIRGKPPLIHSSGYVAKKVRNHAGRVSWPMLRVVFSNMKEADRLLKVSRLPHAHVIESLVFTLATQERAAAGT